MLRVAVQHFNVCSNTTDNTQQVAELIPAEQH